MPALRNCTRYLDHVKVAVMGENSVHVAVQLFESALDGVGRHVVTALILVEVMVAWKRGGEMLTEGLKLLGFFFKGPPISKTLSYGLFPRRMLRKE